MAQRLATLVLVLLLFAGFSAAQRTDSATSSQKAGRTNSAVMEPRDILQRERPAIVTVFSVNREGEKVAQGSGFIVRSNGIVITNYHVVRDAHDAQIRRENGEVFDDVTVLDYDVRHDVIVLKIRAIGLPVVTLADSRMAEQGDRTYAIGSPEGLDFTISDGIVSAHRVMDGTEMLQITTPISHGSSGGPLYNVQGQVIGITTAAYTEGGAQNLNFAVPLKYVLPLLDSIPKNLTLAQVTAQVHPVEPAVEAKAAPPSVPSSPSPGRMSSGGKYVSPGGILTLTVPPGWRVEDPPPKDVLLSMAKPERAMLIVYQSDQASADRELAAQKQVIVKKYGELNQCTKVEKIDKQDTHLRMQVCAVDMEGQVRAFTIAAVQSGGTLLGMLGVSTKEGCDDVLNAIGALQF